MSNPDSPGGAGLDVEAVASAARGERDGERGGDAVRGLVKSVFQMHLALVVTAALVVGALMNVIWVAKFDAPTILALLSVANRTHLLLAAASHLLVLAIVVLFVTVIIRTLVYGEDLPGGVTSRQLGVVAPLTPDPG